MTLGAVSSKPHTRLALYQTALAPLRARISFIPILANGTKAPAVRWKEYQQRLPTLREARAWFHSKDREYGIAFITGTISGGLEMLDFDSWSIYEQFVERMRRSGLACLLERIERGYKERSPKGVHLYSRCTSVLEGNKKLAQRRVQEPPYVLSLIETRGEGGYGIGAWSPGTVHPSGLPYLVECGSLATIQTITPAERALLLAVARTLDEMPPPEKKGTQEGRQLQRKHQRHEGERLPGQVFNERGPGWAEILEPHGWTWVKSIGEEDFWRRPGKDRGLSATTNYEGSDYLYVFSTSTIFEPRVGISKFAARTFLEYDGNFSQAAKALAAQGYVEQERASDS